MMKGEWIILLWALLGTVLLVKTTPVGGLVRRVRRQPPAVQATVALCVFVAVITGGTKPGGTNELSSSSHPEIVAHDNSSLIIQQSSLLPAGWAYDPTDTDGDGIPDLWEKWTHGNRQVADGGIDRDEDGLTDFEEFQNQTDPRTADTDGDGFDDAFEVANGMNPTSPADFTPLEPDADNTGRIDLWENAPCIYGFTDAAHDGFDDYYELNYLESASDGNFDVVVEVYTTRSAVLTWNGGLDGIVVLPTTGQAVRLRLPFGVDSTLNLLPSPEGANPPSGELWKSRMRLAFAPRSGQNLYGNALVSADGMIAHKVVNQESAIEFFAPLPPTGGFQTLSLTGGGAGGPNTDIQARIFDVLFVDKFHGLGDSVGAFTVTNQLGMGDAVYDWSSAFGSMNPDSGMESWLTVTRLPEYDDKMTVVTATDIDSDSRVAVTSIVERCSQRVFSASLSTNNFSPQLGETLGLGVTLPECEHVQIPGWLEIEVVREIIGATQHVASVDMDLRTPGLDRYLDTSTLGGQSPSFAWDGRAQVGLPLADHPDIFNGPRGNFHRAMPAITSQEPVPPPFYTVCVRLWNSEKTEVLYEYNETVFIPQVVKVYWHPRIEAILQRPISARSKGVDVILYQGCDSSSAGNAASALAAKIGAFFPDTVNIRLMHTTIIDAGYKKIMLVDGMDRPDGRKGEAAGPWNARNASSEGVSFLFVENLLADVQRAYGWSLRGAGTFPKELSVDNIVGYFSATGAHEVGHSLGLVDGDFLNAGADAVKRHNGIYNPRKLMNQGGLFFMENKLNPQPMIHWMDDNRRYLEFILPLSEQQ